jgi:hypothetical protein
MQTALATFVPSTNTDITTAMNGLSTTFNTVAHGNVMRAIEASGDAADYTEIEIRAMTAVEELKLIGGMDLAAILMRGKLLKKIEEEALFSLHPGRYGTLELMAREQGISLSELSNVRDLCETIFPFMTEELGMDVPTVFERIGKGNMRELVPVLKAIITGNVSPRMRDAVNAQLDDVAATVRAEASADGTEPDLSVENLRRHAASNLLNAGEVMTNSALRETIRPTRTPEPQSVLITSGDHKYLISELNDDQLLAFRRKVGAWMDPINIELPTDPAARRNTAARVGAIRTISSLLE